MSVLFTRYTKEAIPALKKDLGLRNDLAVPRLEKIVVNIGIGKMIGALQKDALQKRLKDLKDDITAITGQKTAETQARTSISGFKMRKGDIMGLKVTLRGGRAWDFLDRLVFLAMPRMRDFRGIGTESIDEGGNVSIGVREQFIFPEISFEKLRFPFGFQITIATTAKSRAQGEAFLRAIGFPLKK